MAVGAVRPGADHAPEARLVVHAREKARVVPAVGDVGLVGASLDVARLARHVIPLGAVDPARPAARTAHARVILLCAAHPVGEVVGGRDVVELRGREVLVGPGLAAVERDVRAAVVRLDHPLRVVGGDPEVVVVAVRIGDVPKRHATVRRAIQPRVHRPDRVGILGVGKDLHVVPGALAELVVTVHVLPGRAAVVRAVHAALLGLDQGPHPRGLRTRHREPDIAEQPGRKPGVVSEFGPVLAAVGGLEDPAARTARNELPRPALRLPQRRVDDAGVPRVEHEVRHAGRVVSEQHVPPGLAAVRRLVDAPVRVGPERVAERAHIDGVGARRMDADPGDLLRLGEPEERPRPAAVGGLPDAVAVGDIAADRVLAGARVHDVRVRLADADPADRPAEVLVRHRQPGVAAVRRLEHTPARRTHPVFVGAGRRACDGHRAPPTENADLAPLESGEHRGIVWRSLRRRRTRGGEDGSEGDDGCRKRERTS